MLHFIFGRAGSGKTDYIRKSFSSLVREGFSPVLIVPEQYSFETEKAMYSVLGAADMRKARITSFSRLARKCFVGMGENTRPYITEGGRSAVMSLALEELSDNLSIYSGVQSSGTAVSSLVAFDRELRQFEVTPEDIIRSTADTDDGVFKTKLNELSLISEAYRAKLNESFYDDSCILSDFAKIISDNNLFKDETVFFDAFGGFTFQELSVMREIFKRASDVYVTFCADGFDENETFEHTVENARLLRRIASEDGVKIAPPVHLNSDTKRAEALTALEECLRCPDYTVFEADAQCITVVQAADKTDECEFVAAQAKRLVRETGLRCRDIAVIERTEGDYKPTLINAFRRVGLPVFDDSRRSVMTEPLTVFALCALECASGSFRTETLMSYLKTGLTNLTDEEICLVDNYTVIWGINGGAWLREWKNHPDGFGAGFDDNAREKLNRLDELRKKIVFPLLDLKTASENADGKTISTALFELCEKMHAGDALLRLKNKLLSDGLAHDAEMLSQVWDVFVDVLEQTEKLTADMHISVKRYREIFSLIASGSSFGTIPQGLDEITVGGAGRIRTSEPRVVFAVGVNEGVFPLAAESSGVLTDGDRQRLSSLGVELSGAFPYKSIEERFIVYGVLTAPSERLYLSYSRCGVKGEALMPSELIDKISECFPNCGKTDTSMLSPIERVESAESALREAAKGIRTDSAEESTLLALLDETPALKGNAEALKATVGEHRAEFSSSEKAKELFGRELFLSATKTDDYYKCPFRFFCRYGLKISAIGPASLDAGKSGLAVHYVLEHVLRDYPGDSFLTVTQDELVSCVQNHLDSFLEESMGGIQEKTGRFLYLYERLSQSVFTVLERLRAEFSNGSFVPVRFELRIGGEEIPRYELPLNDGTIAVTGYIDRVDVMESYGEKYVRIIDYKTGKQEFKLSDVTAGLNIQMCLYLAILEKSGPFSDCFPAGVLYLPAGTLGRGSLIDERNPEESVIKERKMKSGALSGMILAGETVLEGMGGEALKGYLPDTVYTLTQFGQLSKKIDELLTEMGESLHRGEIPVMPKRSSDEIYSVCDNCDYKAVCGFENGDDVRDIIKSDNAKVLAMLSNNDGEEADGNGVDC